MKDIVSQQCWRVMPEHAQESRWQAADGWSIRRVDFLAYPHVSRRGALLFLPGRGDHYEKYLETLDHWARLGWHVTSIDWRGQGDSGRFLDDPFVGHVDDFASWVADLKYFWLRWKAEQAGPHCIVAHSMGGHITMRALYEMAVDPVAVAMSAPMLSIRKNGLPLGVTQWLAQLMITLGIGHKPAWKVSEKPFPAINLRQKILTHDDRRYGDEVAWWRLRPQVKLGAGSFQWVERAIASTRILEQEGRMESIMTPILLMAARYDKLVDTPRIIADHGRLPHSELHVFGKEAAHELLREGDAVRDICLDLINCFFDSYAPVK